MGVGKLAKVRDYLILLGGSGAVVALDQVTKYLVRTGLELGEIWSPAEWLTPYVRIVHWSNTGAAFGMFPSGAAIFTVIAVVVVVAILYYWPQVPAEQKVLRAALALQFGGAIGNLTDRLLQGTVTDFISVGKFPVFNVADSSISIGVAVLIVGMWIEERRMRAESQAEAPAEAEDEPSSPEAELPAG